MFFTPISSSLTQKQIDFAIMNDTQSILTFGTPGRKICKHHMARSSLFGWGFERVFETVSPHLVYILIDFLVWLDDDEEFSVCLDKDFSERGEGFVTGCLTWSCLSSPRFLNSSDSRTLARGSAQIVNCCAKQDKCFQIFCVHLKKETWKVE